MFSCSMKSVVFLRNPVLGILCYSLPSAFISTLSNGCSRLSLNHKTHAEHQYKTFCFVYVTLMSSSTLIKLRPCIYWEDDLQEWQKRARYNLQNIRLFLK